MNNIKMIFLFTSKTCWNMHVNQDFQCYIIQVYIWSSDRNAFIPSAARVRRTSKINQDTHIGSWDNSCDVLLWIYQLIKIIRASRRPHAKVVPGTSSPCLPGSYPQDYNRCTESHYVPLRLSLSLIILLLLCYFTPYFYILRSGKEKCWEEVPGSYQSPNMHWMGNSL